MAPAARLLSPLEAVASQASGVRYVCSTCRRQCVPQPSRVVVHHARRHNSDLSLTEKVRRKLWGTDKPPGLKDPYGESAFERARRGQNTAEEDQQPEQELPHESEPGPDYTRQTTWEGLGRVGTLDRWWERPRGRKDHYVPYVYPLRRSGDEGCASNVVVFTTDSSVRKCNLPSS